MSRVKERENVLCAGVIERATCQVRARAQRRGAGSSFHSHTSNRTDSQRKDQNSFDDAGWKILPRAVLETANTQQAPLNLEMTLEMNRKSAGRRTAGAAGIAMIPVIPQTEEFEIWR
jgi:hypothetical protein